MRPIKLIKDPDMSMLNTAYILNSIEKELMRLSNNDEIYNKVYEIAADADMYTVTLSPQRTQIKVEIEKQMGFDEIYDDIYGGINNE